MTDHSAQPLSAPAEFDYDVIVIGAGFAGLNALHALRPHALRVLVIEAGDNVGGTWYWNRYPGSRCDVVSIDYSYTFSDELYREWTWSERYAQQPEIESYLNWIADQLDLRRDIRFGTRVTGARYDDQGAGWTVTTDAGDHITSQFLVAATGALSVPSIPSFAGLDEFAGQVLHTAAWPSDGAELEGKRIAVIGTGSSGIQVIPEMAKLASELVVFQRTANFSLPAGQTVADPTVVQERKDTLEQWREIAWTSDAGFVFLAPELSLEQVTKEEAYAELDRRWAYGGFAEIVRAFKDVFSDLDANEFLCEYFRHKIRQTVHDPATAELLCPNDHPIGSKRVCADTMYYETFNLEHVTLVSIRDNPIDHFDAEGVVLADGRRFEIDAVVLATGFDAMTGALRRIGVTGRGGVTINEVWADGPHTAYGMLVPGFPNMFILSGPQSPSVLNNMVLGIEHHVRWSTDCITYMRERGLRSIETTDEVAASWNVEVLGAAEQTLFPRSTSWYNGANIPGKPRVFMVYVGGFGKYVEICDGVAARGYEGFVFDAGVGQLTG